MLIKNQKQLKRKNKVKTRIKIAIMAYASAALVLTTLQVRAISYDFTFTGGDIIATGEISETGGTITSGDISSLSVKNVNESLGLSLAPGSGTVVLSGGVTADMIYDTSFPIDSTGPAFSTGGLLTSVWGLNFWDNGAGNIGWIGIFPNNSYDYSGNGGSLKLTAVPDGGLTAGLLGSALIGLVTLRRKLAG